MAELDYIALESFGSLATAIASIVLVFLLWRTVKQMESTVNLSKVQTEHRFRPWIGPSNSIKFLSTNEDEYQFDIKIKNFGELPAKNVTVFYKMKSEKLEKSEVSKNNVDNKFELGPLLPNMEKSYWFFIKSDLIKSVINKEKEIFIYLYFEYPSMGKQSGYGMISQYNPQINNFIHKDMWVEESLGN